MKSSPTSFACPTDKRMLVERIFRKRHFLVFSEEQKTKNRFFVSTSRNFLPLAQTWLSLKSKNQLTFLATFFVSNPIFKASLLFGFYDTWIENWFGWKKCSATVWNKLLSFSFFFDVFISFVATYSAILRCLS
jgi:hypothetical protein